MIKNDEEYYLILEYIDNMLDKIIDNIPLSFDEDKKVKEYLVLIKEYEDINYKIEKKDI